MRLRFILAISFSLCFVGATLQVPTVVASERKFTSSYDVTYKISETGSATVTENIHLTNQTTEFFASEFILKVSDKQITHLQAFDSKGPIKIINNASGNFQNLSFEFNSPVAGMGKTLNWTLTYETSEIAHKAGNIWEIFIPPQAFDDSILRYTIGLYVPASFGAPLYQKPAPNSGSKIWAVTSESNNGIAASYSLLEKTSPPHQTYDFNLKYHLQNKSIIPSKQQITLPPDTEYQTVFLKKMIPEPENVETDSDGNWLATYSLAPRSKLEVKAIGNIIVFLSTKPTITQTSNQNSNLNPTLYWQTGDPKIKKLAKQLKTPQAIYKFVVDSLTYDKARISGKKNRLGAKQSLENPTSAICMEFTDLFVALSRAANIPAREVDGFGYTRDQNFQPNSSNSDVLHSWPEYFDAGSASWKMVDPTWEKTTHGVDYFKVFDLDHLTFAIHGQNSTSPAPAGSFKNGQNSKDINIFPSFEILDPNKPPAIAITSSDQQILAPFPEKISITIENIGPIALADQTVEIKSKFKLNVNKIHLPQIPPFGHHTFDLLIQSENLANRDDDKLIFELKDTKITHSVHSLPFYRSGLLQLLAVVILTIITLVISKRARRTISNKVKKIS